jgi:hypothetical protein
VFGAGDVGRFAGAFASSGAAGALAVRTQPGRESGRSGVRRDGKRIVRMRDEDPASVWTAAPLWGLAAPVAERLCRDRPPYELENAFQSAIDAGEPVVAVEIGRTRDLTNPLDLVEENFPYLRAR